MRRCLKRSPVGGAAAERREGEAVWIIDGLGIPKKGKHSVGVAPVLRGARQQDNCQVAVSLSLATEEASVPLAYRLYLPPEWAEDGARRRRAGSAGGGPVRPRRRSRSSSWKDCLLEAPKHCVLADAGYGVKTAFRQRLSDLGLDYMVGITLCGGGLAAGVAPLPPKRYTGMGRPPVMPRRTRTRQPVSVKQLAKVCRTAFHTISWRQGEQRAAQRPLCGGARTTCWRQRRSRAAASRGVAADQWPAGDPEPLKYYLSTLPADTPLNDLVTRAAHAMAHRTGLPGPQAGAGT